MLKNLSTLKTNFGSADGLGISPLVTFDDLQKKKMPSTPSKTNCQANYFQSFK